MIKRAANIDRLIHEDKGLSQTEKGLFLKIIISQLLPPNQIIRGGCFVSNDKPGCLGMILKLFGLLPKEENWASEIFPYAKRDDFLSPAELSFYKVLNQVVSKDLIICPKVSLKDIFFVKSADRSQKTIYSNKIDRKHIDFLICKADTLELICGIELDDTSHKREDRVQRDLFFDKVFNAASLKLLRFENKKSYSLPEVECKISSILISGSTFASVRELEIASSEEAASTVSETTTPICPKCEILMVLRTTKKGENKGQAFYGCSNYPKCRSIVQIKND